jgi:hypothetical protein
MVVVAKSSLMLQVWALEYKTMCPLPVSFQGLFSVVASKLESERSLHHSSPCHALKSKIWFRLYTKHWSHSTPLHSTPLHSTPLHSTPLHSTPLQQQSCLRTVSSAAPKHRWISSSSSLDLELQYCAQCQSALYCSKACQRTDWTQQHKKIWKLLNVGHGGLQVRHDIHESRRIQTKNIFEEREQQSLDEGDKQFFKVFKESTFEGSRAVAQKMRKIAQRQDKITQELLLFHSLRLLTHSKSEMLLWPNSPLLVFLVKASSANRCRCKYPRPCWGTDTVILYHPACSRCGKLFAQ